MAMTDAARRAFYVRSRDLWVSREKTYKKKAADAHKRHVRRSEQLAAMNTAVAMPVQTNLAADTNGWTGPAGHDGIDLICPPNAPLYAMVRSRVVRVSSSGWWGKGAPADPALKAKGDGIIILQAVETAGPIKTGMNLCYGHAEGATVRVGQTVNAGQVIGRAGFANAWHVHFMVNTNPPVDGFYKGVGDRDPRPIIEYAKKESARA